MPGSVKRAARIGWRVKMLRTFFSEEVSEVGALVLLLRLLDPAADRGVVDPKLLSRLLERVVHCILPHLLLEPDQQLFK